MHGARGEISVLMCNHPACRAASPSPGRGGVLTGEVLAWVLAVLVFDRDTHEFVYTYIQ